MFVQTAPRDVGFEVVQMPTEPDAGKAQEIKKPADSGGIHIDSVMNMVHWKYPLSSADHAVVEKSLAGMRTSLHNAKLWGADTVLLVPGVVDSKTSYHDAWERSQKQIRTLIPLANHTLSQGAIFATPLLLGETKCELNTQIK